MRLPGGNQHHIPDPTLFDANYADAMNRDRKDAYGLIHQTEMLLIGGVCALALVGLAAWLVLG